MNANESDLKCKKLKLLSAINLNQCNSVSKNNLNSEPIKQTYEIILGFIKNTNFEQLILYLQISFPNVFLLILGF